MKLFKVMVMFFSVVNFSSLAHAQGGHVGGGDPNELAEFAGRGGMHLESWYSVKQDLIEALLKNKHLGLNLGGIDASTFKAEFLFALLSAKVSWDHQKIIVEGAPRPCENFVDDLGTLRIHCDEDDYASAMANYSAEAQYKIQSHEYLGLAGFERNKNGISVYPISSQISNRLSSVLVKKWAVNEQSAADAGSLQGNYDSPLYEGKPIQYKSNASAVCRYLTGSTTAISIYKSKRIMAPTLSGISVKIDGSGERTEGTYYPEMIGQIICVK